MPKKTELLLYVSPNVDEKCAVMARVVWSSWLYTRQVLYWQQDHILNAINHTRHDVCTLNGSKYPIRRYF